MLKWNQCKYQLWCPQDFLVSVHRFWSFPDEHLQGGRGCLSGGDGGKILAKHSQFYGTLLHV